VRRLFSVISLLSLALSFASFVLFVFSGVRPLALSFTRSGPRFGELPEGPVCYEVRSEKGVLTLQVERWDAMQMPSLLPFLPDSPVKPKEFRSDAVGFTGDYLLFTTTRGTGALIYGYDFSGAVVRSNVPYMTMEVNDLALAVLALFPPAVVFAVRYGLSEYRKSLDQERRSVGPCPECGSPAGTASA